MFALASIGAGAVRDAGIDYVEGYVLERVYGTSERTAGAWLSDHLKGLAVGGVVSAAAFSRSRMRSPGGRRGAGR